MKIFNRKTIIVQQLIAVSCLATSLVLLSFTNWIDDRKDEMVVISTPYGEMTVMLYDETPLHKANFLKLVDESFYDSLLFHRVIQGFMIQGGDPVSKNAASNKTLGTGGPGYDIPAEFHPKCFHKKGALAAAREGDNVNPMKESSGSQFYIVQGKQVSRNELQKIASRSGTNDTLTYSTEQVETYATLGGTPHLDGAYTVFGEVVKGMDVIDSIAKQRVDSRNRPLENIAMSMKIVRK